MSRLVVIFTVFLALSAAAAADVRFPGLALPSVAWSAAPVPAQEYTECDGVPAGQRVCAEECTLVLLCMGGSLDPIAVEQCSPGNLCNQQQGACVNGTDECGAAISNITCHDLGMFPDPYDCTVYHICSVGQGTSDVVKCESGWAYDPVTTLCSKELTDDVCQNLPIECNTLGETNAFPGDPNIYYICVADTEDNLSPELYRCPHGQIYDPDSYSCVDN